MFGHYGDRVGRKALLVITMMMMGVATVGIGLVPSYESDRHLGRRAADDRRACCRASASAASGAARC